MYVQVFDASISLILKNAIIFYDTSCVHINYDDLTVLTMVDRKISSQPQINIQSKFILLQTLCEHLEEQNIEGFTDAVKDYDSISRLDQWYTTILLRIKKQHNEDPDLR